MSKQGRGLPLHVLVTVITISGTARLAHAQTPSTSSPPPITTTAEAGPRNYRVESRPALGLLIAGGTVFGTAYGAALVATLSSSCPNDRWLALPIAGPFLTSARYSTNYEGVCDDPENIKRAMAGMDGLVQGVGAVLLASSFLFPSRRLAPNNEAVSWQIAPLALRNRGTGVQVLGAF